MNNNDERDYSEEVRSLRKVAERTPNVWIFTSDSGQAYNATQTDENIKDGDVLIVVNEGIVGIMYRAWPTALTSENGHFHKFESIDAVESEYEESIILAESYIWSEPYYGTENARRLMNQYDLLDYEVLTEKHNVIR